MAQPRAVLDAALELVLRGRRLREQRLHRLELIRPGEVGGRRDREVAVVEVLARPGDRQRLERLRRGAEVADESGFAGRCDDGAVPHRDRMDEVHGLDDWAAPHDYPERLQDPNPKRHARAT